MILAPAGEGEPMIRREMASVTMISKWQDATAEALQTYAVVRTRPGCLCARLEVTAKEGLLQYPCLATSMKSLASARPEGRAWIPVRRLT